ncbi:AAA family ATPase [Parapedobacter koreensis]|uniref:AAA domain (Dynein-related subfamily) n=1 Tax=Parapedobacter koreensis TaxID=332977 RepID=A0A1H7UMB4_9SPHI|nr:AAA family ATPase [Parapedobacter koreensis]SEL97946.1 AAA domain (dynein-related subfamily) [Parapedobacter koreensis]
MLEYHEYEKAVFDWLKSKYDKEEFTFSLRQVASKGAETDYFIGTSKSNYFATTFWYISVNFPGSAGDLIMLHFGYTRKNEELSYYFEFNQTNSPHDAQNTSALNLIKELKEPLESKFGFRRPFNPNAKMYNYHLKPMQDAYVDIQTMFQDIDKQLYDVIALVDEYILKEKQSNPEFIARRFTKEDFEANLQKALDRIEKHQNTKANNTTIQNAVEVLNEDQLVGDPDHVPKYRYRTINQILYGPPGTGKTYNSINEALKIIDDSDVKVLNFKDRIAVKALFDKKVQTGQIVFTTFHQSMSYEDFIEGIKPDIEEDDDGRRSVVYDVKDGIFKLLCKRAISEYYRFKEKREEKTPLDRLSVFDDAWNSLIELTQSYIDSNEPMHLETLTEKKLSVVSITNQGNLIIKPQVIGALEYTVSYARSKKLFDAFPDLNKVNNIDKEFRSVIGGSNATAYWSVIKYLNKWVSEHGHTAKKEEPIAIDEKLITFDQGLVKKHVKEKTTPYILIIDEINRGNVSQIFGELITLIEESKRLGKEEALTVTLPYSKETFGVPPNLHIIGTMNTADRSVEALDAALRRRFSFTEMLPDPALIASAGALNQSGGKLYDLDLAKLLETINRRVEKLVDRDHQIGHSYFLSVVSWEDLRQVFYRCLIPLLQEYFFGDYGKIALVLGKGFVMEKHAGVDADFFADVFDDYEGLAERKVYEIRQYSPEQIEDFKIAIHGIKIS